MLRVKVKPHISMILTKQELPLKVMSNIIYIILTEQELWVKVPIIFKKKSTELELRMKMTRHIYIILTDRELWVKVIFYIISLKFNI